MASDILPNIPAGADVFLDANILIYALVGASPECELLLERCARQEVFGFTSLDIIHEATHRLMVNEAFQKGLIAKPRAEDLRRHPAVVQSLSEYWGQASEIFNMNVLILPTDEAIARRAHTVRSRYGLLTLDSVLVAAMEELTIRHLASHDQDFDRIDTLTVYHATDIP